MLKTTRGIDGTKIEPAGELAERIYLNIARLTAPCYRPEAIYSADQAGWPGDWEGRTLLALVSQWKATGAKPAYVDRIIEDMPNHFNEKGYLGPVYETDRADGLPETVDEQQLSGHNWLLRGLLEYYLLTGRPEIRTHILDVVTNLYLPLTGCYPSYPLDPALRKDGGRSGTISGASGRWKLSSDVGCAFMCLDALSHVYEVFRLPEVRELADEMIDVFSRIDFLATHMQTHATLSAVRGLLRMAETLGTDSCGKYLKTAENIFDTYVGHGMTENYANYNWFGRPDTWTEPCAVVDSMMVALSLFRLTENEKYAQLANRIWYNALGYAQRPNGGYGTDKCVGPAGDILMPSGAGISEAYWCCTMRGAEGLLARTENSVLVPDGDEDAGKASVWLPFSTDVNYDCRRFRISVRSDLPGDGTVNIRATALTDVNLTVHAYTPDGFRTFSQYLTAGGSTTFSVPVSYGIQRVRSRDGRKFKYMRGDLILGKRSGESDDGNGASGLQPVTDMRELDLTAAGSDRRVILFSFGGSEEGERRN